MADKAPRTNAITASACLLFRIAHSVTPKRAMALTRSKAWEANPSKSPNWSAYGYPNSKAAARMPPGLQFPNISAARPMKPLPVVPPYWYIEDISIVMKAPPNPAKPPLIMTAINLYR